MRSRDCQKLFFVADKEAEEAIFAAAEKLQNDWRTEYTGTDEGITVTVKKSVKTTEKALEAGKSGKDYFHSWYRMPYGIQKMSGFHRRTGRDIYQSWYSDAERRRMQNCQQCAKQH